MLASELGAYKYCEVGRKGGREGGREGPLWGGWKWGDIGVILTGSTRRRRW